MSLPVFEATYRNCTKESSRSIFVYLRILIIMKARDEERRLSTAKMLNEVDIEAWRSNESL